MTRRPQPAGLQAQRVALAWRRTYLSLAACGLAFAHWAYEAGALAVLLTLATATWWGGWALATQRPRPAQPDHDFGRRAAMLCGATGLLGVCAAAGTAYARWA